MNQTMKKFGYPITNVKEYNHWCVLLRPEQTTLGSLILICKEDVGKYSDISNEAFQEYPLVIRSIEITLSSMFSYEKINYLMLMMVDPNVHFHIIPRYAESKVYEGEVFYDFGWPGVPELSKHNHIGRKLFDDLKEDLKKAINN